MAKKELPSILRHYDRLAAVAVLAILLLSLLYLVMAGLKQTQQVQEYDGVLGLKQPVDAQITQADLTANKALLASVANPDKSVLLTVRNDAAAANLCTPARRLLCVGCAKPIAWEAKACVYCKVEQPKEKEIDLSTIDTDGDTMPDQWEIANKLNPNDPADADADADSDGFTNIEEFEAKTNPTDAKSHPGYETRMALKDIVGDKIPLRAINKMELPSTKDADGKTVRHYQITFVSVLDDGTEGKVPLRVKDGDLIGKTGFRFVRYNDTPNVEITVGDHKQKRFVNVSTLDLIRESDKKPVQIVFKDEKNPNWPGDPLLELKATIEVDLPGVKPYVVAPGAVFKVKGEAYTVKAIDAEKKSVQIQKISDKTLFNLK